MTKALPSDVAEAMVLAEESKEAPFHHAYGPTPKDRHLISNAIAALNKADMLLTRYAENGSKEDLEDAKSAAERLAKHLAAEMDRVKT